MAARNGAAPSARNVAYNASNRVDDFALVLPGTFSAACHAWRLGTAPLRPREMSRIARLIASAILPYVLTETFSAPCHTWRLGTSSLRPREMSRITRLIASAILH